MSVESAAAEGANWLPEELAPVDDEVCDITGGKSCRKLISPIIGRLNNLAGIINAGLFFGIIGSAFERMFYIKFVSSQYEKYR